MQTGISVLPARVEAPTPAPIVAPEPLEAPGTVFVYLCSGGVQEFYPATRVSVLADEIVVLCEQTPVATFMRSDVFFCSRDRIAPFFS